MLILEIEGNVYEFPTTWDEVTLQQFLQMSMLNENLHSIEKTIKLISILSDIEEEVVERIAINDLAKLDMTWIDKPAGNTPTDKFNFEGVDYRAVEFNNMTLGEFSDVETLVKENYLGNLHRIIAILVRPFVDGKIEKYNTDTLNDRADILKRNMKIPHVNGLVFFFLNGGKVYSETMKVSLPQLPQMMNQKKGKKLKNKKIWDSTDGGGLPQS